MRTASFHALILACLAGCSSITDTPPPQHIAQSVTPAEGKRIADDVTRKLVALYPPARTRFTLQHPTPDAFGTSLVQALRQRGYALVECKPGAKPTPVAGAGAALSYVIDQPLDPGQYRVTVQINAQTLSRIYQTKGGAMSPDGYWIRKE